MYLSFVVFFVSACVGNAHIEWNLNARLKYNACDERLSWWSKCASRESHQMQNQANVHIYIFIFISLLKRWHVNALSLHHEIFIYCSISFYEWEKVKGFFHGKSQLIVNLKKRWIAVFNCNWICRDHDFSIDDLVEISLPPIVKSY